MSEQPDLFDIAISLRALHANVKLLRGPLFEGDVVGVKPMLEALAKECHDGNIYAAAIHAAKDCPKEMSSALIIAVAVELRLREAKAQMLEARS